MAARNPFASEDDEDANNPFAADDSDNVGNPFATPPAAVGNPFATPPAAVSNPFATPSPAAKRVPPPPPSPSTYPRPVENPLNPTLTTLPERLPPQTGYSKVSYFRWLLSIVPEVTVPEQ
jgi:hypothetical protein